MELFLSLCMGVGLSAACGFRVFVPLLVMSVAGLSGNLSLGAGFDWIATYPALVALSVATLLEIAGYYVPWVDNFLDTVATPAAVVAGTVATASVVTDVSPFMKWSLALIAGGGVAGAVQAGTVLIRGASSATTGGAGNPIFATAELGTSVATSLLALVVPLVALCAVIVAAGYLARRWYRAPVNAAAVSKDNGPGTPASV